MNLKEYYAQKRDLVNEALDEQMPGADTLPMELHEAMRYSIFPGGKRIRPILCLAAAESVGAPAECALFPALALELFHAYTLIHDDLPCMDDDDTRRGKPSVHIKFSEANAVLAGDALQALSFEMLARAPVPDNFLPNQTIQELAAAAGSQGVVGGQAEDIAVGKSNASKEMIDFIHLHKTADLFRVSMRLGGIAANASDDQMDALTTYGINLGIAFQITDDILDDENENDEASCIAVYGSIEKAQKQAEKLIARAVESAQKLVHSEILVQTAEFVLSRKK